MMRVWRAAILLVLASERWTCASKNVNDHATVSASYPLRRRTASSSTDSAVFMDSDEKSSSLVASGNSRTLSDAFLDGATVTGTYKYEYKVSQQQVLTAGPAAAVAGTPAPSGAPIAVIDAPVTVSPVAVLAPQPAVPAAPTPLTASAPPAVATAPVSASANPAAVTVPSSPAPTAILAVPRTQAPVAASSANPASITVPSPTVPAPSPTAASTNPAAITVPTPTVPAPAPTAASANPVDITVPTPTVAAPAPTAASANPASITVPTPTVPTAPAPATAPAPLVPALPTEPSPPAAVSEAPSIDYVEAPAKHVGSSKSSKSKKGSKSKAPVTPKTPPPVSPKTDPPVPPPKTAPPVPVSVAPPTSPYTPPPAAPPKTKMPVAVPPVGGSSKGSSGGGSSPSSPTSGGGKGGSSTKSAKASPSSKGGKGSSATSSKGGKGSGDGPSSSKSGKDSGDGGSSSKGPPPPKGSKDGAMELEEYEFEGSLPRTLPVAAFLYITSNQEKPNKYEYEQVAFQTQYLLDTVYRNAYKDQKSVEFMGVEISKYGVLASRLIQFDINVHFYQDRQIPSLWEVESIADAALGSSGSYLTLYLDLLGELDAAPVFDTTTDVLFITNAEDLVRTQEDAQEQDGNMYGGANVVAIVTSLVVSCVLIAGAVFYYYNYHRVNRRTRIFEEENAIEVKRESVNGDQTSRESQDDDHDDGDSSYADSSSYEEVEVVEESDYDEITLEDEEAVDYKKHVGEIKKSYVGTNIAEIKVRKQSSAKEGSGGSNSSGASPRDSTPIRAYPVESHSLLNPLGHPYSIKSTGSAGSPVPILSATAVQVVPSPRPSSPPPVWTNPNLRPVQPKEEQRKDIRAMAKRADDGDNRSLLSIDSQSSATPEFLKKFKQMGLAANPRPPIQVPLNPPPPIVRKSQVDGDERSIVTIDSQSSTTPEFLKKFKQMGLQRYKA